jgi:thymidylate synthase (FAD)
MKVSLISVTPDAEKIIMYCARVSSPHQDSDNPKLLSYCIKHGHWSVFEQATMTVEIQTSRAISAQILRHRSFSFQEFSQRYAAVTGFETYTARRQDEKNRQNSIDDLPEDVKQWFLDVQRDVQENCERYYNMALKKGIAKEQARFLLPMAASTKLYMTGNVRSWIHYLELRCGNGTQLEHREIANQIKLIFSQNFPTISDALGWK